MDNHRGTTKPSAWRVWWLWKRHRFRHEPLGDETLRRVRDALNESFANGGCFLGRFAAPESETFDWFASRNRFGGMDFFERFLTSRAVNEAAPAFETRDGLAADPDFEVGDALTLDGELARLLLVGAYSEFDGTAADAKRLGGEFTAALFGDRYEDVSVYRSTARWSDWFVGIPHWDWTWVVYDTATREVWLLCATDTD